MPSFSPEKLTEFVPQSAAVQQEKSPVMPEVGRDVPAAPAGNEVSRQRKEERESQSLDSDQEVGPAQSSEVPTPRFGRKKAQQQAQTTQQAKSLEREEIEKVLAENVMQVYQMLTPKEQEQFRKAGEEAVGKIEILVTQFRATARTVLHIIRQWLLTIPRINVFFLEQESKIKTDRILKMQQKLKVQNHKTHL